MTAHEPPPSLAAVEFEVDAEHGGQRLDKFLSHCLADTGRHRAALLCAAGRVRVDGRRAKKSVLLSAGATVSVEFEAAEGVLPEPDLPLAVRLERPEFVVVDKPAGMPTAPLATTSRGTLCGALLARYPEMKSVGYRAREPGIVHRLDTQTSGLVLCARSADAFTRLRRALELELLHKRYLAVVRAPGPAPAGEISLALAPDAAHPERVRVLQPAEASGYARQKISRYRVLQSTARYALLEVEVGAAFRHQIRAHLAAIGHPIVGDTLYGGDPAPELGTRHALHASELGWKGDGVLDAFNVVQPLPPELARLLLDPDFEREER